MVANKTRIIKILVSEDFCKFFEPKLCTQHNLYVELFFHHFCIEMTNVLAGACTVEDQIRRKGDQLKCPLSFYSGITYIGIKTPQDNRTDFTPLVAAIKTNVESQKHHYPRSPNKIYATLLVSVKISIAIS